MVCFYGNEDLDLVIWHFYTILNTFFEHFSVITKQCYSQKAHHNQQTWNQIISLSKNAF